MSIKMPEFLDFSSIYSAISEKLITEVILFIAIVTVLLFFMFIYILISSEKWILKWYNAKKIQKDEKPLLFLMLEDLSTRAGIKNPKIYSFDSEIPKMFTVGGGKEYSIAISTSMLKMFDGLELEALLAHEIGHIKNKDVILNTITAFLAGTIMSFPNFAMWCSLLTGVGQQDDPAPKLFRFIATGLAASPAAILVHLTNPSKREFEADEVAVKLTKNPKALAKTLEFLENYISLQPVVNKFNPGHFHLFSTHTQQIRGDHAIFMYMFDTHPETGDRIIRILSCSTCNKNNALNNKSRVPGFFDSKKWKLAVGASFVSWMMPLCLIIIVIIFVMKDFNPLIIGGITGIYTGGVMVLMGIAAKISRRGDYLKFSSTARKRILLNSMQYFNHLIKKG
ncbi:Peptidase M48, Ste24p precursor [Methanosarcina siciliae C2J]|uniref:Peptidase M48, Ste24p n=1 Tax=Methanosarcina siciliae C2J TaxID=1434118 RepID=A0A0E3LDX2_9EURY|nr:M48 family metalloprotease [Methanosarcina siciliae]AKB38016.1 Peptidase M48, Ste24p precursor [Methanosarcina siciliae C2J]